MIFLLCVGITISLIGLIILCRYYRWESTFTECIDVQTGIISEPHKTRHGTMHIPRKINKALFNVNGHLIWVITGNDLYSIGEFYKIRVNEDFSKAISNEGKLAAIITFFAGLLWIFFIIIHFKHLV